MVDKLEVKYICNGDCGELTADEVQHNVSEYACEYCGYDYYSCKKCRFPVDEIKEPVK